MFTGTFAAFAVFTFQSLVEDFAYQSALARTAYTGNDGHHVQGEAHIDSFQVVLAGTFNLDVVVPRTWGNGWFDGLFSQQIAYGVTLAAGLQVFHVALIDYFASQASGIRADVDDVVGSADDFLVMFYHHHRIS